MILPNADVITRTSESLLQQSTAVYSHCEQYRYLLTRRWREGAALVNFCMLNPSTATEEQNDPTLERCERRAVAMGYGGFCVTNLFALRSTDPLGLRNVADPVGPLNEYYLTWAAQTAEMVICGWGSDAMVWATMGRGDVSPGRPWPYDAPGRTIWRRFRDLADKHKFREKLHALKVNGDGMPQHPLYVGYAVQPVAWKGLELAREREGAA